MKRVLINLGIVAALSVSMISAFATTVTAQKAKAKASAPKTFIGYISDSSCGLQHMAGMNEKDCTLMCAKNGEFVLADRDQKLVTNSTASASKRRGSSQVRRSKSPAALAEKRFV